MPVEAVMRPIRQSASNIFRQVQTSRGSRFKRKVRLHWKQTAGFGYGALVTPRRAACFLETGQEDLLEQQQVTTCVWLREEWRAFPQWGVHRGG